MAPEQATVYALHREEVSSYPSGPPFSPSVGYPEYPFSRLSDSENRVYDMVRGLFFLMGLDRVRYGTSGWNPLGRFIEPGRTVLIKPNLVRHYHGFEWDVDCLMTHGSVIRAVLDYVYIALKGEGAVIIGDAPLQQGDFAKILSITGLDRMAEFYAENASIKPELVDFRIEKALIAGDRYIVGTDKLAGDPRGYHAVDLGAESLLSPLGGDYKKYRVTNFNPGRMREHHNRVKNEYFVAGSVISSDTVINLSKMKTHRKAGITAALKNLVGINGCKDWLPHHRRGSARRGGDEFPDDSFFKWATYGLVDLEARTGSKEAKVFLKNLRRVFGRLARTFAKDCFFEGSWYGNDTIWRMILDLNRVLFYCDRQGRMSDSVQRRVLNIVDGIIAGEGEGPLEPTPRPSGLLVGGENPVAVDAAVSRLMGFDYRKIPSVGNGFSVSRYPLCDFCPEDVSVLSNDNGIDGLSLAGAGESFSFEPSSGWKGHIELV